MNDLLLRAARGERTERPPVWLMRQAGRHLPEYRALRESYSFREAISTPSVAAEITLQPWKRYRPDGLVIFSDILVVLDVLGVEYRIESGVGPVIEEPISGPDSIPRAIGSVHEDLEYVGELLTRLDDRVGDTVPLIGFAGGPFTLASYLIAGEPSKTHLPARRFAVEHPDAFDDLLGVLAAVVREHLEYQIDSGADVVQLFDTYAGALDPAIYRSRLLPAHREILDELDVPTIHFVREMGGRLDLLAESGADVVGLDWTVDMQAARAELGDQVVQGNLDPARLFDSPAAVRRHTQSIIDAAGDTGHILNLGHGVDKATPIDSVSTFVETAKSVSR